MKKIYLLIILILTVFVAVLTSKYSPLKSVSTDLLDSKEYYQTQRQVNSVLVVFQTENPSTLQISTALETLLKNLSTEQKYDQIIYLKNPFKISLSNQIFSQLTNKYYPAAISAPLNFTVLQNPTSLLAQLQQLSTAKNSKPSSKTLLVLITSTNLFLNSETNSNVLSTGDILLDEIYQNYTKAALSSPDKNTILALNSQEKTALTAFYEFNSQNSTLRTFPAYTDSQNQFKLIYFTPGQPLPTNQASLTFMGDIMLDRNVRALMDKYGQDYPFEKLAPEFLNSADLLIANLEGPITPTRIKTSKQIAFQFRPAVAPLLKKYSFDLLSLANNHAVDMGYDGLSDTRRILEENNLAWFGHPRDVSMEDSVYKTEINGIKLAFIGLNHTDFKLDEKKLENLKSILSDLNNSQYKPIIFIHWGEEYQHKPTESQIKLAHQFADDGAAAIIGMHPHVVQSFEIYNQIPIFYSLGNAVFDQYFSEETQQGLAVNMQIKPDQIKLTLLPLRIDVSRASLMNPVERGNFLQKMSDWWRYDETTKSQLLQGQFTLQTTPSI